jgi:hypothetical protein
MLAESARILIRRWLWCLVALVVSIAVGVAAFSEIKPGQESKAELLLIPSVHQPGVTGPTNPFFALGNSTQVMTTVVQVLASDGSVATELAQKGYLAKYEIAPNLAPNAGPSLLVKVDGKDPVLVQHTLTGVLAAIKDQLATVQLTHDVPANQLINVVVLTQSPHALPVHKSQVQLAVIATLVVFLAFVVLILLIERRRMTKRARAEAAAEAAAAEPAAAADGFSDAAVAPAPGLTPLPVPQHSATPVTGEQPEKHPVRPTRRDRRRSKRQPPAADQPTADDQPADDHIDNANSEALLASVFRPE